MTTSDVPRRDIGTVLADFARAMADQAGPREILQRMGDSCTDLLPVYGVGVLIRSASGGMEVATANTPEGQAAEDLEVELLEGPCTDCLASGEQLAVPDLEAVADRYPRFVPRALDVGIRAIHAIPLIVRTEQIGSMDVIALEKVDLSANDLATAQLIADVTMSYLANSRAFEEKSKLAEQLQYALDSRVVIEQAKGKLSERRGVTVSAAFEDLRRYARSNQLKLHDVASAVVRGDLDL